MLSPSTRDVPRLVAALLGTLVILGFSALSAGPALAHDSLAGAAPADGATLSTAPDEVVLTFSAQVKDIGLTVLVTSPSGRRVGDGPATVDDREVIAGLVDLTEPGRYTVAYRVVSSDGHPIQGRTSFTLDVAAPSTTDGSPTPTDPGSSAPAASPSSDSGNVTSPAASPVAAASEDGSAVPWVVGGIVLVVLIGAGIGVARSRSA